MQTCIVAECKIIKKEEKASYSSLTHKHQNLHQIQCDPDTHSMLDRSSSIRRQ